jgi:hypothetical protein
MKTPDDKIEAELRRLIEQGVKILGRAQILASAMAGVELAEVSSWAIRLGELVKKVYGEKSQRYSTYLQTTATPNFYSIHGNWNAHIAQMLGLAKSVEHDLEHGLIPAKPSGDQDIVLTDEHGLWWFFHHCTTKTRGWLITKAFVVIGALIVAAYFAGRNHFISQVIDLWKRNGTQ